MADGFLSSPGVRECIARARGVFEVAMKSSRRQVRETFDIVIRGLSVEAWLNPIP